MEKLLPGLMLLLLMASAAPGCSDDAQCASDQDCPADQVCRASKCVAEEITGQPCRQNTDCVPPQLCNSTGYCYLPEQPDVGLPGEGEGEGVEPHDAGTKPDVQPDRTPPKVVSTEPADKTRNVAVDAPIKVVFSEIVKEAKVEAGVILHDTMAVDDPPTGIGLAVVWDEDTLTATLTPVPPLKPYTTYRLEVRPEISDRAGNQIQSFPDIFFTTAPDAAAEAHYEAIARLYAPHIYQETRQGKPKADWITAFDFDENWNGADNLTKWGKANAKLYGTVYWNVTETLSHYFITYATYHPFDFDPTDTSSDSPAALVENSMYGAQIIVAKAGAHAGWQAMEIYVRGQFRPYKVEGRAIETKQSNGIGGFKAVMPADWLLEDRRYQAFIPYATHESCVWGDETGIVETICKQPDAREFYNNSGVHYFPAEQGAGKIPPTPPPACVDPCACPCGAGEFCDGATCVGTPYGFRSLAVDLFSRIHVFPPTEDLWSATYTYLADLIPADRGNRPGYGLVFPRHFAKFTASVAGAEPGAPPWAWDDDRDNKVGRGQWFIDPAYALRQHLEPAAGDVWKDAKTDYCWNVYLGYFNWKAPGCSGAQQ